MDDVKKKSFEDFVDEIKNLIEENKQFLRIPQKHCKINFNVDWVANFYKIMAERFK